MDSIIGAQSLKVLHFGRGRREDPRFSTILAKQGNIPGLEELVSRVFVQSRLAFAAFWMFGKIEINLFHGDQSYQNAVDCQARKH